MKKFKFIIVMLFCFFTLSVIGQNYSEFQGRFYEKVSTKVNDLGETLSSCTCIITVPDSVNVSKIKVVILGEDKTKKTSRLYLPGLGLNEEDSFFRRANIVMLKGLLKCKYEEMKVFVCLSEKDEEFSQEVPVSFKER